MTMRVVAISLKIPDNAAYTALVALRKLGVHVERVERAEIRFFEDDADVATLTVRIESDETIFNPNKHKLAVLDAGAPRSGEVWIESLGPAPPAAPNAIGWRLIDARGGPVSRRELDAAIDRLLCNPAIERAVVAVRESDRDISVATE
jgi:phosphoribosylformylglycinamidine (FGAM) synthase PurS component